MVIPQWLSGITGAQQFANNPANGYQPTIGDALQGIGHSMMQAQRDHVTPHVGVAPQPQMMPAGGVAPIAGTPGVAVPPMMIHPAAQVAPVAFAKPALPAVSIGDLANTLFK